VCVCMCVYVCVTIACMYASPQSELFGAAAKTVCFQA
jgi:hypothetical protein